MPDPTPLSPAAQAVLDVMKVRRWEERPSDARLASWVIRQVAEHLVPETNYSIESPWQVGFADRDAQLRRDLAALADELGQAAFV